MIIEIHVLPPPTAGIFDRRVKDPAMGESETNGSACTKQPEYWSDGVLECWSLKRRKSVLEFQSLSGMRLSKAMKE